MNYKTNYKKYFSSNKALKQVLDIILPPRCPISGDIVDRVGAISPKAWKDLTFISDPKCTCCGFPFELDSHSPADSPSELLCAGCLTTPKPYDKARSVFVYNDASRMMVLAFKHGDKTHLHTSLAPLLYGLGQEFLTQDSLFIPIPLHWLRLLNRRYNQAAILAIETAKLGGHLCWPDALIRTRHTPPQGHKSARDRHQNVANAFDLNSSYAKQISGKNIVLIDDVFTTGATLEECTKVLKAAGATTVNILTVARVVRN